MIRVAHDHRRTGDHGLKLVVLRNQLVVAQLGCLECRVHGTVWVRGISLSLYLCTFLLKPCLSGHPL